MTSQSNDMLQALTEKEKQTLRLIVRGHDAKSVARTLGLAVHTINERLRDVRRKMAVSSSREAARLLLEAEGGSISPCSVGDTTFGDDADRPVEDREIASRDRRPRILIGVVLMTVALALLTLAFWPHGASAPSQAQATVSNSEVSDTARAWLALVDQGRWDESYRGTGTAFQKLNTAQVWASISEKVRTPLGAMISRTLVSQENLPAPPYGYEVVKFRTRFANKPEALETVTLERENDDWRVVGVTIE